MRAIPHRRYAAYLGATTEWNKWEGITYDASRNRIYTAMSVVAYGMEVRPARLRPRAPPPLLLLLSCAAHGDERGSARQAGKLIPPGFNEHVAAPPDLPRLSAGQRRQGQAQHDV